MILDENYLKSKATEFFQEDRSQSEDEYIDNLVALLDEIKQDTKQTIIDKLTEKGFTDSVDLCKDI